ncbi:hypothetical protein VM1G_00964 [Cytospora mali]|uniref:BZIP domain-containing protein n=1 Tax=Cytospora mali TaxID=578113 RepID=A0A194VLU8_CYTMA|nr:hypothetical protein VM1G_00964 [Valsa mali]
MSQGGSASRPPSRRRSQSQSTATHASPSSLRTGQSYRDDSRLDSPRGPRGMPVAQNDLPPRQTTPRTLGVHTILNPSDPRDHHSGISPSVQRSGAAGDSSPSSVGTRQYGVSGSPYQPYSQTPVYGTGPAPSMPSGAQQESPTATRPFPPALGAARRILTPRSPRSHSFSRVASPSTFADSQPPFGYPSPQLSRQGGAQDLAPFSGHHTSMPHQSPRTNPLTPATTASVTSRSYSQSGFPNAPPFQFPQESGRAGTASSPQAMTPTYPQGQYGLPQGTARGYAPPGGPPAEASLSTAIINALQTGGSGARGSEVQPHLTLQTNTGEHFTVPLDVHQGSRQADEKRHRNAGASARFRARKKERDKDMRDNLQRLENDNRELSRQTQDLQAERDFYRNERNRLRDVVMRTPSIREHAEQGPPSPRPTQVSAPLGGPGEGSFTGSYAAGGSSASSLSPVAQQHPPPYSGDSLERPTRRRRTDPTAAEFTTAPYAMRPAHPQGTLPPIVTQGYTGPIASAPSSARLPPLRFDQPGQSPTTTQAPGFGAHGSPLPLQTQYPLYGRPPHETGWATGPRDHQDPGRRGPPGPPGHSG